MSKNLLAVMLIFSMLVGCVSLKKYKAIQIEVEKKDSTIDILKKSLSTYNFYLTDTSTALLHHIDSINIGYNQILSRLNRIESNLALNWLPMSEISSKAKLAYPAAGVWGKQYYLDIGNPYSLDKYEKYSSTQEFLYGSSIFSIPPPRPTARMLIDDSLFKGKSLVSMDSIIKNALKKLNINYTTHRLEDQAGFAISTSIQEFHRETGNNMREVPHKKTGLYWLWNYFIDLLFEAKGYYRVLVFVVTDQELTFDGNTLNLNNAAGLIQKGTLGLDKPTIQAATATKKFKCYFLVYEFEKTENNKNPDCRASSNLTAREHLEKSRILQNF